MQSGVEQLPRGVGVPCSPELNNCPGGRPVRAGEAARLPRDGAPGRKSRCSEAQCRRKIMKSTLLLKFKEGGAMSQKSLKALKFRVGGHQGSKGTGCGTQPLHGGVSASTAFRGAGRVTCWGLLGTRRAGWTRRARPRGPRRRQPRRAGAWLEPSRAAPQGLVLNSRANLAFRILLCADDGATVYL